MQTTDSFLSAGTRSEQQRLAEEKVRHLATLIENVSDIIISQDTEFKIISWNKAAEITYGYPSAEAIGHKLHELLPFHFQEAAEEMVMQLVNKDGAWKGEASVINRFGRRIILLSTITRLNNEAGEFTGYVSVSKDITGKREAQELLRKSELFYRNLIGEAVDGIVITDAKGIIGFVAPSARRILGYETDPVSGRCVFDFVHPEDREKAEKAFQDEFIRDPKAPYINIRLQKKDGTWLWCNVRGINRFENPVIGGMVVYFHDDTGHMKALNELRNQAITLSNVFDLIITCDFNYNILSWNKRAEQVVGFKEEEVLGKYLGEVAKLTYENLSSREAADILNQKGYWQGEISFLNRYGVKKTVLHTASYLLDETGKRIAIIGTGIDITEKKNAEEKMHESEIFYRNLAANSFDGIALTDASGIIKHCGPSTFKVSGYHLEELVGKNIFDFVYPEDAMLAVQSFFTEVSRESVLNYLIIRLKHATRGWVWCTVRAHNLLDDPILRSIVIYFTDDTKRKQIEDKLRESEGRFRNMIHNLKLGIVLQNEKGEMLVCNQSALNMLGQTEEQLMGIAPPDPTWNIIREDGSPFPPEQHPVTAAIMSKQPVKDVVAGVFRPATNDRVWLLVNADPILNDEGKIINVICSYADITEQKKLSQQLIQQEIQKQRIITQATIDGQEKERLEIGKELHDNINQHLTTTRLYLEVARDKADGETQELLRLAHKNLSDIVSEIRKLSQSLVPPTLGDIGLTESIQDLCDSLKRAHSFSIEFNDQLFEENNLPDNLKLMIFRIIQEQVSNIIRHARATAVGIQLESGESFVILRITDNGQGFDLQRYKPGMGLSNIANRAGLFGGKMEIDSSPGAGCTVTVTIPLTPAHGTN